MSQKEKYQMMIETPIPGLIGKLAVPTIISMLVTSFYNMADTFFVGKIGTSATAAVGVAFPVMAIIQALGFFCGHGSGNSISRKLGARENNAAKELAATGFFGGHVSLARQIPFCPIPGTTLGLSSSARPVCPPSLS